MEFLDTFQLPFGNHLTGIARSIGDIALYNSSVTAIDVLDTLLVCNLPIIVGRTVTLADDTAEITALAGVELAVSLSVIFSPRCATPICPLSSMVESIEPDKR